MVSAVSGLPRVGSSAAGSAMRTQESQVQGSSPSTIPTTTLYEDSVVSARKKVMSIMEGNAVAPRLLADLFREWMFLIGEEQAAFSEFGAKVGG